MGYNIYDWFYFYLYNVYMGQYNDTCILRQEQI